MIDPPQIVDVFEDGVTRILTTCDAVATYIGNGKLSVQINQLPYPADEAFSTLVLLMLTPLACSENGLGYAPGMLVFEK
jgi:hypothetical protein